MIAHLRGRENTLEPFGWTGRRAEWIALACLHSGVFTRAQWTRFLGCHTEKVRRAVHALIAQGVATEENVSGITGIGRRRITSTEVLVRRLLSLDYVLEHPHLPWLPTEPEKVRAFEALGIERRLLPLRVYRGAAGNTRRYFPLKLPVALDAERAVFVHVDPGYETGTALRSWGAAHRELWKVLRERGCRIEVVAVARTWEELIRAQTVLGNWARDPRPSEYDAEVSLEIARIKQVILKGDLRLLREVCGDIQGGLRRMVELEGRARRQAGRGLIHRTTTWQSARLARAGFR